VASLDSAGQGGTGKSKNPAVGILLDLKDCDYEQKLQELGLTKLEERRHQSNMF
jgi:hypothetical protein